MLKALELVGFKSFADKTRFEFPRGITVIVGPNGSGKSNVVDAIKWVLGEQSVKSLRGKEMADCIFNGSATRRPLNTAEATLTLDNSAGRLAIDSAEVQITRRVYRSGEGEYLINRQPCRLRDIRDLFAGTGLATEAYSVIEQGKVDVLLQSSKSDRRLIFEEAAGIGRFKAKKVEAQRRLERVEGNLLRLSDIVEEVDSRLRGVRIQAGKARKYKEYSDRLQSLRTQVGLADWRSLSVRLRALDAEVSQSKSEHTAGTTQADSLEAQTVQLEVQMSEAEAAMRTFEARIARNRERTAAHETTIEHLRRRAGDWEEEIARHRQQLSSQNSRVVDLARELAATTAQLTAAAHEHELAAARLVDDERALMGLGEQLDTARAGHEQLLASQLEQLRLASSLGNATSGLETKLAQLQAITDRGHKRLAELAAAREVLSPEVDQLRARVEMLTAIARAQHEDLSRVRGELAEFRRQQARLQEELVALQKRHSAASERASVLEELENRLEGLSAGVKQVLQESKKTVPGPFREVRGLVADLLHVNFETAPLVELALGEMAQCLVVADGRELLSHLQSEGALAGRVGFVRLDVPPAKTHLDKLDLSGEPGVLGRGDSFVETAPEFAVMAKRLLGKTWFVETLADALRLSESTGRGLTFLTRAGELLTPEGTLYVGRRHTSTGLISRRSELRVLKQEIANLVGQIEPRSSQVEAMQKSIVAHEERSAELAAVDRQSSEELAHERLRAGAAEERLAQLEKQYAGVTSEQESAAREREVAQAELARVRQQAAAVAGSLDELETQIADATGNLKQLETQRQRNTRATSGLRVEVVKADEQLRNLRTQLRQIERDQEERGAALGDSRALLAVAVERLKAAERDILRAEMQVAELYLQKENFTAEAGSHAQVREERRMSKLRLAGEAQRLRGKLRKLEPRLSEKQLALGEVQHERTALESRLREDYGIELAALEHEMSDEELQERDQVEREIAELRNKLNSIGHVNLDALAELEELETRFQSLSAHHQDLSSAKASLEQIIGKINADSRRLFKETFDTVRGHFQTLFRMLFGGGQADLVLEENVDILDSGIEIVARPPGKEPRSISLLSGGEKTLACVALLLAIFRSRPSPFCVLDEVDAALDEANIERFMGVLNEFLTFTQFIVVTHSKKTMTSASTLYGVTMQESGVSKRVSVQFNQVAEDGQILDVRPSETRASESGETQAA